MGELENTFNSAMSEIRDKFAQPDSELTEINKSLQEINQSIIGTGETILDLNKTLTRLEDCLKVVSQNLR